MSDMRSTGTTGTSPQAPLREMRRVFERQRETALRLRTSTAAERIEKIRRLRDAIRAHTADIHAAGAADFRKPPEEIDLTEIVPVLGEANEAIRKLKRWMKPKRVWPSRATWGHRGWVQYEPKGRCLIISPWNYPVNLTFGPLVSAIAAGNTVILKPSEMTPHLSGLMVKIVRELFAEDEVAIYEGDAAVSQALLELPFDHIFFTGSPAVGKIVMAAAAKNLTSVTLELGGKSPTIIDASANLKEAARTTMWAKFTNNGQTCIAPDYIYVHTSVREKFVGLCRDTLKEFYGVDAAAQKTSPDLARVVNERHTARLKGLLDDATARGARVLVGGVVDEFSNFIAPTLLDNISGDARIMQEEIFGPLLPIVPFEHLDDVIARINAAPKPLALYMWSRNKANIRSVLKKTSAGGTCINNSVIQYIHGHLPFGGINNSGIGNAHGVYGFRAFSHERAVLQTLISSNWLFYPPARPLGRMFIRWLKLFI
jgi:aldehyde dehydrogenase (NAD+)